MIQAENLTRRYGDRLAVDGVSFRVEHGEVIGFLGPNGAGKSTTLRMLTGFLAPSEGTIRIGDVDAVARPVEARRLLGYMPETVPLHREMRVREYLAYRARLKTVPRREVAKSVDRALERTGIGDVRDRIIGQLSKGYRSRVGLADALVADPPLLILDEPTAGLDPNQIRQVRTLIRELAGDKTVLLSTHILPEVETTCGRVLIIHQGKLVGEGAPGELRAAGEGGQVFALEARGARERLATVVRGAQGVRSVSDAGASSVSGDIVRLRIDATGPDVAEAIAAAITREGMALRELRRESASLEEVFARLTTQEAAPDAEPSPPEHAEEPDEKDEAQEEAKVEAEADQEKDT